MLLELNLLLIFSELRNLLYVFVSSALCPKSTRYLLSKLHRWTIHVLRFDFWKNSWTAQRMYFRAPEKVVLKISFMQDGWRSSTNSVQQPHTKNQTNWGAQSKTKWDRLSSALNVLPESRLTKMVFSKIARIISFIKARLSWNAKGWKNSICVSDWNWRKEVFRNAVCKKSEGKPMEPFIPELMIDFCALSYHKTRNHSATTGGSTCKATNESLLPV